MKTPTKAPFYVRGHENEESTPLDKNSKTYMLVLFSNTTEDETPEVDVRFIIGQANAREYIKTNIDSINVHDSFVLVEDVPFGVLNGKPSVYEFMRWISKNYSDDFDIEDYVERLEEERQADIEFEKRRNAFDVVTPETYQSDQISDMLNNAGKEEIK